MKPEYYKNEKNIDIIDFCKMYNLNFNRGNVLKYIARAGKKENELEDLKKAMEYLKREIEHTMTLKEKFAEFCKQEVWEKENKNAEECELIADEYAIEFAEWCFNHVPENIVTSKELLEIFKKEKGL